MTAQTGAQHLGRELAQIVQGSPAQGGIKRGCIGADLLQRRAAGQEFLEKRIQRGLGGSAENGSGPVMVHQLCNGSYAGAQIGKGQGLRLVENNDAVGDVVQLAAAREREA